MRTLGSAWRLRRSPWLLGALLFALGFALSNFIFVLIPSGHAAKASLSEASLGPTRQLSPDFDGRGMVILGAVGRPLSAAITRYNVEKHFPASQWDCLILSYKSDSSIVHEHPRGCRIVLEEGWQYGNLMYKAARSFDVNEYEFVAIVLDDVLLDERTFHVPSMLRFMTQHQLDMASPVVAGVGLHWAQSDFYNEVHPWRMAQAYSDFKKDDPWLKSLDVTQGEAPQDVKINGKSVDQIRGGPSEFTGGRRVTATEIFSAFWSRKGWKCLSELFNEKNSFFHGYDACYMSHCEGRRLGRIGVHDGMISYHTENALPPSPPDQFGTFISAEDTRGGNEVQWTVQVKAANTKISKKWREKSAYFQWVRSTFSHKCKSKAQTLEILLDEAAMGMLRQAGR